MVFGWRRGPKAGRTWLLHTECSAVTSEPDWISRPARAQAFSSQWGCLSSSRGRRESFLSVVKILIPCHFNPTGSSSQSFPALDWLPFLLWDLLCEDARPPLRFYVLVINFGPQLFQLSFNMSMPIILNLVSWFISTLFILLHNFWMQSFLKFWWNHSTYYCSVSLFLSSEKSLIFFQPNLLEQLLGFFVSFGLAFCALQSPKLSWKPNLLTIS